MAGQGEDDFDPVPGMAETLTPGMRRILAPNPSPMTFHGTNTFVIGDTELAVIDPGPDDPAHLSAILSTIGDVPVTAILVTHSHRDHSPLARSLSQQTGAPVVAFGDSETGRSAVMAELAANGLTGGGEGVDVGFVPDRCLPDGARIPLAGDMIEAIWTPGHMGNHMAYAWRNALFCGDLVMGWASTMISPPDGDLTAFFRSCETLRQRAESVFHPAHGAPLTDPKARIDWLVAHRRSRETQILEALAAGPATPETLTARIYSDVDPKLLPAAMRNVMAHLIDLHSKGTVTAEPFLAVTARFERVR